MSKKVITIFAVILAFLTGGFSSLVLRKLISNNPFREKYETSAAKEDEEHTKWVNKLQQGGYFLHLRHAMREKWDTATSFDAIAVQDSADARNENYYRAVCLTEKGIIESKLTGEIFKRSNIKVSYVVSSPSCRARETAIYAFNRIDQIEPSILHRTAQIRSQHKDLGIKFRKVIDGIEIKPGENVIISGHGGTLSYDLKNGVGIVDINEVDQIDQRLETGIIVIERVNGKYYARHKFNVISDIANNSLLVPVENKNINKFTFDGSKDYKPENINKGLIYNRYNDD